MNLIKLLEKSLKKLIRYIFNFLFNIYSVFLRAHLGHACKFQPTCSCYAKEAFQTRNFFKASVLVLFRILRCHPFGAGGFDPVPKKQELSHG